MTTVTVNGQQYSDDGAVAKDMQSGGFRTYLLEMLSNAMIEMNGVWCGTAGGTANALTLTPATANTVCVAGQIFRFKAGASPNSAATTVAVSGLSAIAVQVGGAACAGGEIVADKWYQLMVDASLTSAQLSPLTSAAVNGNATQTFSMTTAAQGTNTTQGASTAFVMNEHGKHKNILINGGFTINQIGYVSAATLAAGVYGHDGWKAGAGGGDYSFTQLNSDTTITIAASKTLIQVVRNKNVQHTAYVLSWTGTAQARYAVNSATPGGSYAASPIVISGQTAGTTMSVEFNTGTLVKVQLEPSAAPTGFEYRTYEQELALCTPYYEKITIPNGGTICGGGYVQNTNIARFTLPCAPKYAAPTLAYSGALEIMYATGSISAVTAAASVTHPVNSQFTSFYLTPTGTPLTAGDAIALYANGADAIITLSARL